MNQKELFKNAKLSNVKIVDEYLKESKAIYHDHSYLEAIEKFAEWSESKKSEQIRNIMYWELFIIIVILYLVKYFL